MSGSDEKHKQKVVIGGLLNIAGVLAKRVLTVYNPDYTYNTNHANVLKCNGKQLEDCATLLGLKVRSDDGKETKLYKNKIVLADRIILKIESLFEAKCSDCHEMYQNTLDSKPPFTCRLCWGVKNRAIVNSAKLDAIKEDHESEEEPGNKEEPGEMQSGERVSPRRGLDVKNKIKNSSESNGKICELYKRRSCPHGKSGKKLVDGGVCPDRHPKRCFKFCDYGQKHSQGCKKGKRCQFWHPKLCKHSMKGKVCDIEGCTFQHLKYLKTQDEKPPPRAHQRESETENPRYNRNWGQKKVSLAPSHERMYQKQMMLPKVSLASSMGTCQPTVSKGQGPEKKRIIGEESFLMMLIENMRAGFQEQIEELRKEIVKEREPHYLPAQSGGPAHQRGMLAAEQICPVQMYHTIQGMAQQPNMFQTMMPQRRH
ncbi:hypothetical protein ACHWQZ_G004017 [Mnemiopsis leidyi]